MRLHCENDDDDVDEDYNNNGLRSPKNLQYETVYFKKLHKDRASRAGLLQCQLLQVCTSFSLIKVSLAKLFRVHSVAEKQNRTFAFLSQLDYDQDGIAGGSSEINLEVQWNLGITKDPETGRICSLYNEVSFYRVSFPSAKEHRQLH